MEPKHEAHVFYIYGFEGFWPSCLRVLRHTHALFVELLLGAHISETVVAITP